MKLQLAIIIPVLIIASCKSHIGIYCTKPNYNGFCYELKKNGEFKYDEGTCTFASQGIGKYEITGDTIKFRFEDFEIKRGNYEIEKNKEIEKGIMVDLSVVDSQSKEPILAYSAAIYSNGVLIGGEVGDLNGKAELVAAYNENPVNIEITFTGYHPLNIEINEAGRYEVNAEIVRGGVFPIRKQEWIFRLIELNKDSMVIGEFDIYDWSRTLYRYEEKK